MRVTSRVHSEVHCPLCRVALHEGQAYACETCGAELHLECVRELGPCHGELDPALLEQSAERAFRPQLRIERGFDSLFAEAAREPRRRTRDVSWARSEFAPRAAQRPQRRAEPRSAEPVAEQVADRGDASHAQLWFGGLTLGIVGGLNAAQHGLAVVVAYAFMLGLGLWSGYALLEGLQSGVVVAFPRDENRVYRWDRNPCLFALQVLGWVGVLAVATFGVLAAVSGGAWPPSGV